MWNKHPKIWIISGLFALVIEIFSCLLIKIIRRWDLWVSNINRFLHVDTKLEEHACNKCFFFFMMLMIIELITSNHSQLWIKIQLERCLCWFSSIKNFALILTIMQADMSVMSIISKSLCLLINQVCTYVYFPMKIEEDTHSFLSY